MCMLKCIGVDLSSSKEWEGGEISEKGGMQRYSSKGHQRCMKVHLGRAPVHPYSAALRKALVPRRAGPKDDSAPPIGRHAKLQLQAHLVEEASPVTPHSNCIWYMQCPALNPDHASTCGFVCIG